MESETRELNSTELDTVSGGLIAEYIAAAFVIATIKAVTIEAGRPAPGTGQGAGSPDGQHG